MKIKIIAKNVELDEYTVKCSKSTFSRLDKIIEKQNRKLLKDIALHYKWSFSDLCDKFLNKNMGKK